MLDTGTPARLGPHGADDDAPRWRNLWFVANPAGTVWSRNSHPSRAAAEQAARDSMADMAAWLDAYGDAFCDLPFEWLAISRLRFGIPLPDPHAP